MNPYGDIDLTRYLQTEGRRRAAALAKAAREKNAPSSASNAQQQCGSTEAAPCQPQQASSLTEVLIQMGVTSPKTGR